MGLNYKKAGVDVEAGYKAVALMNEHIKGTLTKNVLSDIGGFSGLFSLSMCKDMAEPVLVSGADGVGTKLKVAFLMDKHDTIGIDCVAMCVNDIVCCGAKPLFFLDYIACGKNHPEKIAQIVKGVADGLKMCGASLIGGETAEMPGFYPENEYDLAGFTVGIIEKSKIIDGSSIQEGDVLIGLASSGIHSNGYSLVRNLFRLSEANIYEYVESIGSTLGEALLAPTKIYVNPILNLMEKIPVKGVSHITGGGFMENIPRMFKKDLSALIQLDTWPVPPIFNMIKSTGDIDQMDMFSTFNMGIGMVVAVSEKDQEAAIKIVKESGEDAYVIGKVTSGKKEVVLC